MTQLTWDQIGHREYQSGVDRGVLFIPDNAGNYVSGYAWNGLTGVSEAPTGATPNAKFANNIKYLNLISTEEFGGTIDAYTYPDQFAQCDGTATPTPGVSVTQQNRRLFGLSYRTQLGNDIDALDHGYKLHLVFGAFAEPSAKAFKSVNDTPDAVALQWKFTTTPVSVPGLKPSSLLVIDSTKVDATALANLESALYGSVGVNPRLPLPADVLAFFSGTVVTVTPAAPTFNATTKVITIPAVTGIVYSINGIVVASGPLAAITADTVVLAEPTAGYKFPAVTDNNWFYSFT